MWKVNSFIDSFQFQTGAIKSEAEIQAESSEFGFQFQTGAIKSEYRSHYSCRAFGFNSKLVRLETTLILYCTLTVPVKLIFIFSRFETLLAVDL